MNCLILVVLGCPNVYLFGGWLCVLVMGFGKFGGRSIYLPAYQTVVETIPRIRDEQLILEAEQALEKANMCIEKIMRKNEEE